MMSVTISHKNDVRFIFTSSCFFRRAHVLYTLFVFVCVWCCQTHIALCFCFVFLRLVYPVLPVYLDFPFLNASSIFSCNVCQSSIHMSLFSFGYCNVCQSSIHLSLFSFGYCTVCQSFIMESDSF